uniref:Hemolysin E n=1 Tax=Globodera pallida TaxID=36090 RepID=A0A183CK36_GLOPA
MTTTGQRTNDQERIQREIASVANAIGTVIYGFKLAILPFAVQYEFMANDMKSALDQVGLLSSYLKDMAEPVENKLKEYLKITKNRLLAYPDVDETLINAQTKTLEKFISNYTN